MRKYYITLSALLIVAGIYAQKDISLDKAMLKQALMYSDNSAAINSMYGIIAKEGATSTYKDSLEWNYIFLTELPS